jgi:signal transduction histidine kinase
LHDVVAHSISVIAVQSGVATHFLDEKPDETRAALDAIGRTSRATLGELRRLLGVLRGDDGHRSHAPAPTLGEVPDLVDEMRALGLPINLEVAGEGDAEHRAIEMSAYRVVQEALTNVLKHAGPTNRVTVRVAHRDDGIGVWVEDDGRGAGIAANSIADQSGHHGLIGMRERVDVWGGELRSGPRPGGGFMVHANFPFEEAS